jgi:hypothetical protein
MFEILLKTAMLLRKMGPRPEDEPAKTDAQIVDDVLKEKTTSRISTFLAHLGVGSSSRKNAVSTTHIRVLEERLAEQENLAVEATVRYKNEMDARMVAQGLKFEDLRLKQEEELVAIKKYQEDKTAKQEKRLSMDFVSQEHGVPRDGPKDSNAGG